MTKAIIIPADTTQPIRAAKINGYPDLSEAVGGMIQPVDGEDFTAYVNEEGKLIGLDFNPRANSFIHAEVPTLPAYDLIVGDVVVLGSLDEEGDETDVPERVAQALGLTLAQAA
ncbi:DUF3846 domain-containing protein [Micrococcus luteus]|uniref:DUF3846 domain-containing protein n=1 Tax=Micrococcus luteus TaxID=1270 RepID=UPI0023039517|nr:DUF3846 domain-containing protein [Micrococcus luteus]